jgi:Tol biopolymer transport system component
LAPDEKHLAVAEADPKTSLRNLWVIDVITGASTQLTSDFGDCFNPVWSPDEKWIYFTSTKNGRRNIYRKRADAPGPAEALLEIDEEDNVEDVSPDGRYLIFNSRVSNQAAPNLTMLSLNGSRKRIVFSGVRNREDAAQFSPDGRWVAYRSDETGKSEIMVRALSANGQPTAAKWQVSNSGGNQPRWSADGQEIYYLNNNNLMAAHLNIQRATFANATPQPLFKLNLEPTERRNRYVISKDGRILALSLAEMVTAATVDVQLNWQATLKRR